MSDQPTVYLPAKIVDQDEDGYIYEAGARRHKRPFVSVEPVGTLTVRRRMQRSGGVLVGVDYDPLPTALPDGKYLIVEADDE